MAQTFAEICDGYGIEEVPNNIIQLGNLSCAMCSPEFHNRKLYTCERITYDGTNKDYREMIGHLITNCYCKYHTILMYGEQK